jgi:hypothetical protein
MDERTTRGLPIAVIYGAAALLAVAVLPLPYGYYQLLRLVATVVFAWASFVAFQRGRAGYGFGFVVVALLFNPVLPVYLSKALWAPIDLGAALALVVSKRVIGPVPDARAGGA